MAEILWSEKYRPQTVDDLILDAENRQLLKNLISRGELPHLLLAGPEGAGKISAGRIIAREILGQSIEGNYLEVFGKEPLTPDERKEADRMGRVSSGRLGSAAGKSFTFPKFIQIRVKPFVEVRSIGTASFKILVIHDFHVLETEQQGFRRLMETYGGNCRMILITPYISGIIDPILSRTQIILFRLPNNKEFDGKISRVAQLENIQVDENTVAILFQATGGRLGLACDILQLCSMKGNQISGDMIFEAIKELKPRLARALFQEILNPRFNDQRKKYREILNQGLYTRKEIFAELTEEVHNLPISPLLKAQLINVIATEDAHAVYERNEETHASALLTKLAEILGEKR